MNRIILIGRMVGNPELKYLNDKKYLKNSIAVPRDIKNKDGVYETDFFNFTVWGSSAEYLQNYCKKGDLIGIVGKLQNNNYEKDGQKVRNNEIYVNEVKILTSRYSEKENQNDEKNEDNEIEFLD